MTTRYVQFKDGLYLVEQEIPKNSKAVSVSKNLNHIFIYDRSGSMYGLLEGLCNDLKARLRKTVQNGDTVTLGWFSSEGGQFRFPLKGYKVTNQKDFDKLDKVIDENNTTIGCTCFSEILTDTEQVVKDLSAIGNKFALVFLTDGYPVVSNYTKELETIKKAIKAVSGKISSSLMVGYGHYYNKELLSDMAERFGGALVHQTKLEDFPVTLGAFMDKARDTEDRILVELYARPHDGGAVFSLDGSQVNVYAVEDGKIAFAPTKGQDRVFVLTNKEPKNGLLVDMNVLPKSKTPQYTGADQEIFLKASYAAALVLTQRTKTDVAMDVLSTVGDVALVEQANNAFTNAEYGAVEQSIVNAIGSEKQRFLNGKKVGCLPDPEAFCVIDALDTLMADEEAEFQPYHENFEYQRIGVKAETKDGYPQFHPDKESRVPMTDLVWHDTKLNCSVRAKIKGSIDLPEESPEQELKRAKALGKTFDTFVYRNYTIVKDGFLNTPKLTVSMSKETFEKFVDEGIVDTEKNGRHYKGRVYTVHLDRIPVMNRAMAEGNTSAKDLCKDAIKEMELMGVQKALKFLRNEIEPAEERGLDLGLTEAQEAYLKDCGVTKNGFAPPVDKEEPKDFYMAKEFEVKIAKLSSLPKVDEVREKIAAKKPLTASQELVATGLKEAEKALKGATTKAKKLATLDKLMGDVKKDLGEVRGRLQRTKFSVLLAKKWFDEIPSRDNTTIIVDGKECTFNVREVKVSI